MSTFHIGSRVQPVVPNRFTLRRRGGAHQDGHSPNIHRFAGDAAAAWRRSPGMLESSQWNPRHQRPPRGGAGDSVATAMLSFAALLKHTRLAAGLT